MLDCQETRVRLIKLVIAGSRTVDPTVETIDAEVLKLPIDWQGYLPTPENFRKVIGEVIDGDADGGDRAGRRWADARGIPVHHEPITPEDVRLWGKYVAPKMRNRRMSERGDIGLVFWDGKSNGATDFVTRMVLRRKHVEVVPTKPVRRQRARGQAADPRSA